MPRGVTKSYNDVWHKAIRKLGLPEPKKPKKSDIIVAKKGDKQ